MSFPAEGIVITLWLLSSLCCDSAIAELSASEYEYANYLGNTEESDEYLYYDDSVDGTDCPAFCTCLVSTVVDCSRRNFKSIFATGSDHAKTFLGILPIDTTALHLGFNNLTALPALLFWREGFSSSLHSLFLQGNEIRHVHPDAFAALPNLTNLDLSNNRISKFRQRCRNIQDTSTHSTHTFSSDQAMSLSCATSRTGQMFLRSTSTNLLSLNLNSNTLRRIPSYSFLSFSKLEVLKLNWNKITWISRRAFTGLVKLKVLQLRSNHLSAATLSRLGVTLGNMVVHNLISGLQTSNNRQRIAVLRFHETRYENEGHVNSLRELDLGDTGLTSIPNIRASLLERLYLDSNRITNVTKEAFYSFQQLEVLHLGGNHIGHIEEGTFALLGELEKLDLSRNHLRGLAQYTFEGLRNLLSLRLHENPYLSEIHPKAFARLWSLRLLYLQNCNLTTLHTDCWIHTLKCLWLYGNPIDCNCDISYNLLATFQQRHPKPLLDPFRSLSCGDDVDTWAFQSQERSTCAKPDFMAGLGVHLTTPENLNCRGEGYEESNQFRGVLARVYCEERTRQRRRFQRFSQDAPSDTQYSQMGPSGVATLNDFESLISAFSTDTELVDYGVLGSNTDPADEADHSANLQSGDVERGEGMLSMLYSDLLYGGEWNTSTQATSRGNSPEDY